MVGLAYSNLEKAWYLVTELPALRFQSTADTYTGPDKCVQGQTSVCISGEMKSLAEALTRALLTTVRVLLPMELNTGNTRQSKGAGSLPKPRTLVHGW